MATKPEMPDAEEATFEQRYVYCFGGGVSEGGSGDRDLLGGKSANLAEMTAASPDALVQEHSVQTIPGGSRSISLRPVHPDVAERMRRDVGGETDAMLNEQFGISYNTWRKIRRGEAIRASVAARLEKRFVDEFPLTRPVF